MSKRPDMRAYFHARIDWHVNGFLARTNSGVFVPADVRSVAGDITDSLITVTMVDGSVWHWSGGRYATRKRNGCYAPLMPHPVAPRNVHPR